VGGQKFGHSRVGVRQESQGACKCLDGNEKMAGPTRLELATSGVTGENVRLRGFAIFEFSGAFSRDCSPRGARGRRSPTQFRRLKWHTYRHTCQNVATLLPVCMKVEFSDGDAEMACPFGVRPVEP
jgi:hypothetical protein